MIQSTDPLRSQTVANAAGGTDPASPAEPHHGAAPSWFVQKVVPFLSSLAVHAGLLMLAVVAANMIIQGRKAPEDVWQEQTSVAVSGITERPGGIQNVGFSDPFRKMSQDSPDDATLQGTATKRGPSIDFTAGGPAQGDSDAPLVLGLGSARFGSRSSGGPGGNGADGPRAMFGNGPGGAIGAKSPIFAPSGGGVRRIVFVCDASGSMLNKMATLKDELAKTVQGLRVTQSFNIIFFHDESFVTLDGTQLLDATPDAKRKAAKFLEGVVPAGTTDPIRGLEAAFRQQPQLIYLLTDGDFPDNAAVLAKVHEQNKGNKVRINTIAFVNNSDTDEQFRVLLRQVAQESGGTFRDVNEADLGQ